MHRILTDYLAQVALDDPKLRTELERQVESECTSRLAQGAEEEYLAKQLVFAYGDAEKLRRDIKYEYFRASRKIELMIFVPLTLAVLIATIVTRTIGAFSVGGLLFVLLPAALTAAFETKVRKFSMKKAAAEAQLAGIIFSVLFFMIPIVASFQKADFALARVMYNPEVHMLPDMSTINTTFHIAMMALLYGMINITTFAVAKVLTLWRSNAEAGVRAVLHIRYADRMS